MDTAQRSTPATGPCESLTVNLARQQWCVHPQLSRGEALSWWLHRFAWSNALSNHTFAYALFGGRTFWPRDVDRFAPTVLMTRQLEGTGVDMVRLEAATLRRYEGILFPRLTTGGWLPWVTPVGVYHRTYRHHGHAYCPRCLAEGRPILLSGRVAFEVACLRHLTLLRDGCPRCDAPVTFARVSLATPGRYPCPVCGANLTSEGHRPLMARALAFEHRCHTVIRAGVAGRGLGDIPASDFFTGVRILVRGLYSRQRLNGVTDGARHRWMRCTQVSQPALPFEHWRLTARTRVLATLEAYLSDWPTSFLADAGRSYVYRCRFESDGPLIGPAWVTDVLDALPTRRRNCKV